jgi:NAD(P)-dependent dehydrogenase (short-subunit alcohol dehydrogenase family)
MDVDRLFSVKGNVAIITGASAGLGQVFAEVFASKGAKLAICARREKELKKFAKLLENRYGTDVLFMHVDVTKEDQIKKFCGAVAKKYGRIDILVNNVGTSGETAGDEPSFTFGKDKWDKEMEKNLTGTFLMAREAAKYMAKNKYGKIINLSSVLGLIAANGWNMPSYYASKGGIVNLTRGLAVEFAKYCINVNAIAPGTFPSQGTASMFKDPKTVKYIESLVPLHRMGKHDDLKGVILFLASHASDYITGHTLPVDGGWTIW